MPTLVKILVDDNGTKIENPVWHLDDPYPQGVWGQVFCSGEVYGEGESAVIYQSKTTKRGGVQCSKCLEILKAYKSVKL